MTHPGPREDEVEACETGRRTDAARESGDAEPLRGGREDSSEAGEGAVHGWTVSHTSPRSPPAG
jgi:hypothetical protein